MNKNSIVAFVLLLVVGAFGYVLVSRQNESTIAPPTGSPTDTAVPTRPVSDLEASGSSYMDPSGLFVVLYPSEYVQDGQDKYVRLYKTGPSQKGQTEMYDGVIIVFEPVALGGQTLTAWIDERIKTQTADGTVEITKPKTPTTINTYPGFIYTARGLGESTYYVIQKNSDSENALVITTAVMDPGQLGFQGEVDSIFATLELLK